MPLHTQQPGLIFTRRITIAWSMILPALLVLAGAGCTDSGKPSGTGRSGAPGGRNPIVQQPFDQAARLVLLNVGKAYEMCLVQGKPPRNADDLEAPLATTRDGVKRQIEVVYGVDLKRLPDDGMNHRLAWEKEPTGDGYRLVLMADLKTVKYQSTEEFDKTPKAK